MGEVLSIDVFLVLTVISPGRMESGARTHLASPATAATAIKGKITTADELMAKSLDFSENDLKIFKIGAYNESKVREVLFFKSWYINFYLF